MGIHAITYEYTWWMDPKDQGVMIDAIDKMVGDYQFTCPVQEFAQRYADTFNDVSVKITIVWIMIINYIFDFLCICSWLALVWII